MTPAAAGTGSLQAAAGNRALARLLQRATFTTKVDGVQQQIDLTLRVTQLLAKAAAARATGSGWTFLNRIEATFAEAERQHVDIKADLEATRIHILTELLATAGTPTGADALPMLGPLAERVGWPAIVPEGDATTSATQLTSGFEAQAGEGSKDRYVNWKHIEGRHVASKFKDARAVNSFFPLAWDRKRLLTEAKAIIAGATGCACVATAIEVDMNWGRLEWYIDHYLVSIAFEFCSEQVAIPDKAVRASLVQKGVRSAAKPKGVYLRVAQFFPSEGTPTFSLQDLAGAPKDTNAFLEWLKNHKQPMD